jgi:DNA-binding CsgD family transcriptional regulator
MARHNGDDPTRRNGDDPTSRRRWDPEAQRKRDAEILRRLATGDYSQRDIAKMMDCTLGTVQHVKRKDEQRRRKIAAALTTGEHEQVLTALDDEMTAEDVETVEDVERLAGNSLELYRLHHHRPAHPPRVTKDLPAEVRRAAAVAWAALPTEPSPTTA